jgi:hypothetical protein
MVMEESEGGWKMEGALHDDHCGILICTAFVSGAGRKEMG